FSKNDALELFIYFKIIIDPEAGYYPVHLIVLISRLLRRARYDEGCSRLIDQNAIHLVNYRIVQLPLRILRKVVFHVVPEIIKSKLVICTVGDIGSIGLYLRARSEAVQSLVKRDIAWIIKKRVLMLNHADREPQEMINGSHPLSIPFSEIIIHRDNVHSLFFKGVQVNRQCGHKGFPFTRLHLGYFPFMQHNASNKLDIEVSHLEETFRYLSHCRKRLTEYMINSFTALQSSFEFLCFLP